MTSDEIKEQLKQVKYPGFSRDIVSFGLVRSAGFVDGTAKVEVQKTRSQRDDPAGRLYRPGQFDIVAACMFSVSGIWDFRFKSTRLMQRDERFPDRLAAIQRIDGTWQESLTAALAEQ